MSVGAVAMKFGGTSVADPDAINRLIAIVRDQAQKRTPGSPAPVVIVSALSGVTDKLVAVAQMAEDGEGGAAAELEGARSSGTCRSRRR